MRPATRAAPTPSRSSCSAVQLAVIVAPLSAAPWAEVYGWHWGFGAAGVGMLIGLAIYLLGPPLAAAEAPHRRDRADAAAHAPLTRANDRRTWSCWWPWCRCWRWARSATRRSSTPIWSGARRNYQLLFFGHTMPVTWLLSFGSIISAAMIAAVGAVLALVGHPLDRAGRSPSWRSASAIAGLAPLSLALPRSSRRAPATRSGWAGPSASRWSTTWASPTSSRSAWPLFPRRPKGRQRRDDRRLLSQSVHRQHPVGWLGGLLEKMPAAGFWLLHAGLVARRRRPAAAGALGDPEAVRPGAGGCFSGGTSLRPVLRGAAKRPRRTRGPQHDLRLDLDRLQEILVVAHHQQGAVVAGQARFDGGDGVEVQMVGGLVQDQQLRWR